MLQEEVELLLLLLLLLGGAHNCCLLLSQGLGVLLSAEDMEHSTVYTQPYVLPSTRDTENNTQPTAAYRSH